MFVIPVEVWLLVSLFVAFDVFLILSGVETADGRRGAPRRGGVRLPLQAVRPPLVAAAVRAGRAGPGSGSSRPSRPARSPRRGPSPGPTWSPNPASASKPASSTAVVPEEQLDARLDEVLAKIAREGRVGPDRGGEPGPPGGQPPRPQPPERPALNADRGRRSGPRRPARTTSTRSSTSTAGSPSETEGRRSTATSSTRGVRAALADPDRLRYWVAESPATGDGRRPGGRHPRVERLAQRLDLVVPERLRRPRRPRPGRLPRPLRHIRVEAARPRDVVGLRLYVEDANERAQETYQALGMIARRATTSTRRSGPNGSDAAADAADVTPRLTAARRRRRPRLTPPAVEEPAARPESIASAARATPSCRSALAGDPERGGGVGQDGVADRAGLAGEQPADPRRRCRRARRRGGRRRSTRPRPKSSGSRSARRRRRPRPRGRGSARRARPRRGRRRRSRPPRAASRAGRGPRPPGRPGRRPRRPTSWNSGRAGLASGPTRLNSVRNGNCSPHRRGDPQAGVEPRGEQEGDPQLGQAAVRRRAVSASTATPSSVRTSALPELPEAARLPCLATGTPQAATTIAAAVETFTVLAPSPPVPQVSSRPGGGTRGPSSADPARGPPGRRRRARRRSRP